MDDPSFYGFPVYGEAGPKVAQDCGGQPTTPATRTFEPDEAISRRVRAFLAEHLPGALGPEILTRTCLYTLTPERDFVVDRLPDAPGIVVGLGAAHGFKYASVLGRILVELALDGRSPSDGELGAFRIDRPLLLEADPPLMPLV
jgi:sarcosine oxidase